MSLFEGPPPTREEVYELIARGRSLPFSTGSPIAFRLADGTKAVIKFEESAPDA